MRKEIASVLLLAAATGCVAETPAGIDEYNAAVPVNEAETGNGSGNHWVRADMLLLPGEEVNLTKYYDLGAYASTSDSFVVASRGGLYALNPGRALVTVTNVSDYDVTNRYRDTLRILNVLVEDPRRVIENNYPIHVYFTPEVPAPTRKAVWSAAAEWSRILSPTETAPYYFTKNWPASGVPGTPYRSQCGVEILHKAGDVLEPGLHLHVGMLTYTTNGESALACRASTGNGGPASHGESAVETEPIAVNGFARPNEITDSIGYFIGSRRIALHELGHSLGIGMGARWTAGIDEIDGIYYFTDSVAVAEYKNSLPERAGEPGIYLGRAAYGWWMTYHWGPCAGFHGDIMQSTRGIVTSITAVSLGYGYSYDPNFVAPIRPVEEGYWHNECAN